MKRRVFAAALSAALVLALAACGGGNNGGPSSKPGGGSSVSSGQTGGSSADGSQAEGDGNEAGGSAGGSASSAGGGADVSEPEASTPVISTPEVSGPNTGAPSAEPKVKLTLNRTNIELNKAGATFKLNCKVEPDTYDGLAVFTSSDTKVVTVDESGKITAVAPGKATITVKYDSATATASVNCNWTETQPEPSKPADTTPAGGDTSKPADDPPAPANVDLSAFYSSVTGKYSFAALELADNEILDMFYEGMSAISAEQRLIYVCSMTMNNGEFGLVQVKDSKDVDTVKSIFQARIDAQASGGAWYPQAVESWTNNARVVSNGNYVMMVVHESCDDIVKEFNALF